MMRFDARLDILPEPQRRLWLDLKQLPRTFVLYGGTAIALRLAHRQSVDFDFFSSDRFAPEQLLGSVPFLAEGKILQREAQTLSVALERKGLVKVSFFGGLSIGRVQDPEETSDGVLWAASLLDLAGLKAAVIQQRAEAKDYLDLLALIDSGIGLPRAIGAAQALYGQRYNPMVSLKALTYFEDGNLRTLTDVQKNHLINLASERFEIPTLERIAGAISPASQNRT